MSETTNKVVVLVDDGFVVRSTNVNGAEILINDIQVSKAKHQFVEVQLKFYAEVTWIDMPKEAARD